MGSPNEPSGPQDHLFVVRIRLDPQPGMPKRLVGSLEHVEHGERRYFSVLGEVEKILDESLFPEPAAREG